MTIKTALHALQQTLWPYDCILCGNPSQIRDLCAPCQQDYFTYNANTCQVCGLPFSGARHHDQCGTCLRAPPAFQKILYLNFYKSPLIQLIGGFKYFEQLAHGRVMADLLALHLKHYYKERPLTQPQGILPVPLHTKRLRQRGYNQALEIAKPLAKQLNLPLLTQHAERTRDTPHQSQTLASQRRNNVKNAFAVKPLPYSSIAIVDDIVTTGHTVNHLSQACLNSGATLIHVWCLARTI